MLSLSLLLLSSCTQTISDLNIPYEKYTLDNGLDVVLSEDHSDPIVALAIQFHVGSNREVEGRTGFAHLFEHIMFQRSENVPEDQFFKIIQDAGGTLNGGTGNDATTYYEVVPKNSLEKILWLESDRMGFLRNTITQKTFAIQQNVVQNEKRQGVDNSPYGFTGEVIAENLYPNGHPYSWTVIGKMEDLFSATLDDVKEFHKTYYVPNNATLVLAGDFDPENAKALIEKYFGEIPRGEDLDDPEPWPVNLDQTKKLYHEDNFARAPQLRLVWPTVEEFQPDSYALSYLGQLLSRGKKAPLYNVLVKEKELTSYASAYNSSQEIAGVFQISVTANPGVSLQTVEDAIFEAFKRFEEEGFTDEDVEMIKASQETSFYNGISSILGKSFQLANYNEYAGSPGFYTEDFENFKSVTKEDILEVYNKYIKDRNYLATSFVPKGNVDLAADGSADAGVIEEDIMNATQVEIAEGEDENIEKTPSSFDRSVMPESGPDPDVTLPDIWEDELSNGLKVYGIYQDELPLVQFDLTIIGGHYLDNKDKPGVASLVADLMNEGTASKTPLELEEAIDILGSRIRVSASSIAISISGNTLTRNFKPTMDLVKEMLLEPRWDGEEFGLSKKSVINGLKRQKANPNSLANDELQKLVYGEGHILSTGTSGTEESVESISIDDLKAYYSNCFSPVLASFHVAGKVNKDEVLATLEDLNDKWPAREVNFPEYEIPPYPEKAELHFIDVPGAKQSVISIGCSAPPKTDPDYFAITVMNNKLGGSFNGWVNMVLREEKGYTYGARTGFSGNQFAGSFRASSSVRSTATEESVQIFRDLMDKYRRGISQEDLEFTKNSLLKSYARQFETLGALLRMLEEISMYNLPYDYIKDEQETIRNMTLEQHKKLAEKYIKPDQMYYVIAGDAETQAEPLTKMEFGKIVIKK